MASKPKWILRIHTTEGERQDLIGRDALELVEDNDYLNTRMALCVSLGYIVEVLDARSRNLISVPEDYIISSDTGLWLGVYVQVGVTLDNFLVEYV